MKTFETINYETLIKTFEKHADDCEFSKSTERIAKMAAQIVDISNKLTKFDGGYGCSPERIFERKEALQTALQNKTERIKRAFFWLNRVCKNTVGSSFLMIRVNGEVEQISDICSDYLDYIGEIYKSQR